MTATIHRLTETERPRTPLDRCLTGHHAQGPMPGGPIARMQSESALRRYVRGLSRRHPLGERNGDVWRQVEDVLAFVPSLASCVRELDDLAHTLRRMVCGRRPGVLCAMDASLRSCRIGVSVHNAILRMRLTSQSGTRIITLRLHEDGATRLDDRTVPR